MFLIFDNDDNLLVVKIKYKHRRKKISTLFFYQKPLGWSIRKSDFGSQLHSSPLLSSIYAIYPAPTHGADIEIVDGETGGSDSNGELKIIAFSGHLDYVDPEKEDLHADALQTTEFVLGNVSTDSGIVLDVIGSFK